MAVDPRVLSSIQALVEQDPSNLPLRLHLADLLLEMAGGGNAVEMTLSHQDLASRIGTVREIVTRTLGKMAQEGAIRVEGHTIHIVDRGRLKL